MPTLYYTPTSCGAASFIVAHALGLGLACETVDLGKHTTASGADFYAINPKGNVPALVLDDGTLLNEGAAVLQWLGDQARLWRCGSRCVPTLAATPRLRRAAPLGRAQARCGGARGEWQAAAASIAAQPPFHSARFRGRFHGI
jgi:glutathione S-transferase